MSAIVTFWLLSSVVADKGSIQAASNLVHLRHIKHIPTNSSLVERASAWERNAKVLG